MTPSDHKSHLCGNNTSRPDALVDFRTGRALWAVPPLLRRRQDLWADVPRRPDLAVQVVVAAAERRAEPKVADLQDVRASSALRARVEYVFGFQVPVRDLVAVAVADRLDHLCERDARLALRVMILRRDPVEEFAAAAVLDDHAKLLLVQVAVVQPADVRVVDAAHRPDLDRELRDRPRVGVAEVDDLDRADVASVRARERDKNGAEAPLAQLPSNHVVALDGLQPEVVRGMRREKFEPTQAVVDGRAADGPRQLRGHRCRARRLFQ